ncbi:MULTISPECIES: FemAB family XrtA/PEP-CTERM system-associated protein [unclassified Sphingopyxis]|uniref:FemAB family XrtA/PEP-CTERM system-associated protein n=1 Tax=unclassified Sphingopyxis TaxID=2614943 RepID=UPI002863ABBC|nr:MULTISPECIES: FemAB family XrtA/PEP-CTERM system-associated protein [unclassified Sphingopyxis]MDR6832367.1 FemAB-related protein (PEP-CTERM system-associated) [Sphingopyxis sp. BE122]MDR7228110.1 FemAB-related protein (PEP-CTERM system-associated) [Sphingopyxis sp. BE259]
MTQDFSGAPLSDAAAWDAYVAAHPQATPFHSRAWCEAITAATGHRCHLVTARDAGGALTGLLPLHHIRSPLFGQALVGSGFAVDGGILADNPAVAATLAYGAAGMAKSLGVPSVELRGGPQPDGDGWRREADVYAGFARDLCGDDDAELLAIPRKQRAEVRKVLDGGLTVTTGRDASERRDHYRIYATSVRNLGTPVFPKKLFDAVLDAFGDGADILTVRRNGKPVASVLSLYWRGTVMPYWGGGTADARRLRANELMYFALMRHARAKGCTRFDFGRSKIGTGPYSYKKNWGFEPQLLVYARWLAQGETPRDTNPNSAKYRLQVDLWKKLPLWAANRIGPLIARGLG